MIERHAVVLAPPADIADPGRKIRHGDEFIVQPGIVGYKLTTHLAGLAFRARKVVGIGCGKSDWHF